MMHPNCEKVQEALRVIGLPSVVKEFPESTKTAAEAAAALGVSVSQIAKSLVFLAGGKPLLVIASGSNRVSLQKLEALCAVPISKPDADSVKSATGFPIGGVPPLGHTSKLPTLIDQDLLQYEEIWAAAGTPRSVFPCTPQNLISATEGQVVDLKE